MNGIILKNVCFGGMGGTSYHQGHRAGDGGNGGKGGCVTVSEEAKIYAFNGNMFTDGTSYEEGKNQCPIYLQAGILIARYEVESYGNRLTIGSGDKYYLSNEVTLKQTATLNTSINKTEYVNLIYTENTNFADNKILNINTKLGMEENTNTLLTNVDMSKQGVGSGAGYIEISNGTYTIDENLN